MEYLIEYGLYVAKFITVVAVLVGALLAVLMVIGRARAQSPEQLEVRNLNRKYEDMALALKSALLPPKQFKQAVKEAAKADKERAKQETTEQPQKRIFVCRFNGDMRASAVANLTEEITAILTIATATDEVVAVIESAGGTVHGYGLGASQLQRIRDRGIPLTAAVDKVAASGGYMMACVANQILAAPFAIIGSIGVVAQLPNFNRLMRKHDIDYELVTAGEYKRTLTMFGENTDDGRAKFREELEDVHGLFKDFVSEHRPDVDISKVATGEHWFGRRALDLKLVDSLMTSDEYLARQAESADIFEVKFTRKKNMMEKLTGSASESLGRLLQRY